MTVNGKFPGPTLYAREDDRVIVRVTNRANHNLTIHWSELPTNNKLILRIQDEITPRFCSILIGMGFDSSEAGGLMDQHISHSAQFNRVRTMSIISLSTPKEAPFFGMLISLGLEPRFMAPLSSYPSLAFLILLPILIKRKSSF